eukprot:jgi/Ulvmu1/7895/UM004_0127.1
MASCGLRRLPKYATHYNWRKTSLHQGRLHGTETSPTFHFRSSAQHVMSLDILQQATSLSRLAQIIDECSVSASDPQVAAIAVHKLAVMGTDVANGSADMFGLLQLEGKVLMLCEAAAVAIETHGDTASISFHGMADALTGLSDLTQAFDSLKGQPAVLVYAEALARLGLSRWNSWDETAHVSCIEDLACLLDALAILCPAGNHIFDSLALKIVCDLETSSLTVKTHQAREIGNIRGLCSGIWALAAYYGFRNRDVHPQFVSAHAAEMMQFDHPNNIAAQRCLHTPQGYSCRPEHDLQQPAQAPAVETCMSAICLVIRDWVVPHHIAVTWLKSGDAIVRVLAGIVEVGSTTAATDTCLSALLRLCTHEMQRQALAGHFQRFSPLLPAANTAIIAAAVAQMTGPKITSQETVHISMRMLAVQLAENPPGSLNCEARGSASLTCPHGMASDSMDLVSLVSVIKSALRINMLPPAELLLALEPHCVAVSSQPCSPAEFAALAELPELLMLCGYSPGPSLVETLCSAIARSTAPLHVKARQILCATCQSPVTAHPCLRKHLEDFTMQLYKQDLRNVNDHAAVAWTLSALLDATIMVHGHAWEQLHRISLDYMLQHRDSGPSLKRILHFSQCMHASLACSCTADEFNRAVPECDRDRIKGIEERTLSPMMFKFPGMQQYENQTAVIRQCLTDACTTRATTLFSESTWQELMSQEEASHSHMQHHVAAQSEQGPGCEFISLHSSNAPWLQLCIFASYTVFSETGAVLKHGRVALVLTPPHLEAGSTAHTVARSPFAFTSCKSCAASVERLGFMLEAWQWPAVAVVGKSWHALVDCVQQQSNAASLRADMMAMVRTL